MKRKMSNKKSQLAYILNKDPEFDKSQSDIAEFLGVSQGTVSNAIRAVEMELTIKNLQTELSEVKAELIEHGFERKQLANPFLAENVIVIDDIDVIPSEVK